MNLSIVILTYNSQKYLKQVLESCVFASEVLMIDSGSSDNTINIAKKFQNTKVIYQPWLGFGKQKQAGVNLAKYDFVFVLDSDEIIPNVLKDEIISICNNPIFTAYYVPRLNFIFGKAIRRCGLYPDATIRLFNRKYASFSQDEVHEKVITNKPTGLLHNHMIHFAYTNIEEFIIKQNKYSSLNKKNNLLKAIFHPYWTFFKIYVLRGGFLEGRHGFIIAKLYAQYTFWKYVK